MTDLAATKFFVTPQHKCSYLPRQDAVTLFADPKATVNPHLYSELSELGFRRSGNYLYRPHCKHCSACIPVRIPVERFRPSRKQRRVLKRNADLEISRGPARNTPEHYALYERYIAERHRDGDMFPPTPEQFSSFLLSDWSNTTFIEFRVAGRLVGVAVCDEMPVGLSAVYTFYDPAESGRSLGVLAVLVQIREASRLGLPALYLGYWIRECQKMNYKTEYHPLEMYVNNQWTLLT
jgi:arginyl-tRNA--protein-N-Asp/Glu arginylyltransferase